MDEAVSPSPCKEPIGFGLRERWSTSRSNAALMTVPEPVVASLLRRWRSPFAAVLQAGRLHNSIALAAVGFASLYAAHPDAAPGLAILYLGSWIALFLGVYLVNDLCDAGIDAINKPWKPIPTGRLSASTATFMAAIAIPLGGIGITVAGYELLAVSPLILAPSTIGAAVLGVAYSLWIKRRCPLAANCVISAVVAICALLPLDWGDPNVSFMRGLPIYLLGLLGREYLKDVADFEADAQGGRRTSAVVYGPQRTIRLSVLILGATLLWSLTNLVPAFRESTLGGSKYAVFALFCAIALTVSMRRQDVCSANDAQGWLKPGLLGFLALDVWQWTLPSFGAWQ